ncbi:MAG: dTDP-glucose 4,6-dehydratase [Polyangiaceae bacterium]
MRVLVTGGCGFIGTNVVRSWRKARPDWTLVNLDKLTYAANPENLADLERDSKYVFVRGDIGNEELVSHLLESQKIDAVVHMAAESHVDRSILGPGIFIESNVRGTQVLLDACKRAKTARFVMVSTDEVYGSLGPTGLFTETTPLAPSSPYSASKAAADLIALAYHHTFKLDVVVTRCSNNYGAYQFPEKFIPLMVTNALRDESLPVYGDGGNVRDWIHVEDHASGIMAALERGKAGETYNFGGASERKNIDVAKQILAQLKKPETLLKFVQDRAGHDRRYAIDASKAKRELDWTPSHDFENGLAETVRWYETHPAWIEKTRSGEYRNYYDKQYGARPVLK